MYERETPRGEKVTWEPDDQAAAEQAMEDVDGTGVPDHVTLPDEANVPLDRGTLPDEANVPLDRGTARKVRERYLELIAWDIAISLDDGQVQAGGSDGEPVSVSVTDQDGNLVSGDHVVVLDVDGDQVQVQTVDGQGVYDVTTTKPAGSTVTVQAVNVADHPSNASAEQTIDVV